MPWYCLPLEVQSAASSCRSVRSHCSVVSFAVQQAAKRRDRSSEPQAAKVEEKDNPPTGYPSPSTSSNNTNTCYSTSRDDTTVCRGISYAQADSDDGRVVGIDEPGATGMEFFEYHLKQRPSVSNAFNFPVEDNLCGRLLKLILTQQQAGMQLC